MSRPSLTIHEGDAQRTEVLGQRFVVGAGADADLRIEAEGADEVLFVLSGGPGGHYLDVLGEGLPVVLNGLRVLRRRALAHRDVIEVGEVRIEVTLSRATTRRHLSTDRFRAGDAAEEVTLTGLVGLMESLHSESSFLRQVLELSALRLAADWAVAAVRGQGDRVQAVATASSAEAPVGWEALAGEALADAPTQLLRVHDDGRGGLYASTARRGAEVPFVLCYARAAGKDPFSKDEAEQVAVFVRELGRALLDVRRLHEATRLQGDILHVRDEERRRVGQDLHDGICQELVGIGMMVKLLERKLEGEGSEHSAEVAKIGDLVGQATTRARALARGLSPIALDDEFALVVALGELATHSRQLFGIDCTFECGDALAIHDPSVANHLYYLAREAVGNAAKHSGGEQVRIELREEEGHLVLTISDDGAGLGSDRSSNGMGLRVMGQRARQIRGELSLQPSAEGGLRVRISLPWRGRGEGQAYWLYSTMLDAPALLLAEERYSVGRGKEAALRMRSSKVSRRHAELRWEGDRFEVVDLGSTNGTTVNDVPVTEPVRLEVGDRISFGGCEAVLGSYDGDDDLDSLGDVTQRITPPG